MGVYESGVKEFRRTELLRYGKSINGWLDEKNARDEHRNAHTAGSS